MIILFILTYLLVLVGLFLIGWFLIAPPLEWACNKIFELAIKGHEYRAMVNATKEESE